MFYRSALLLKIATGLALVFFAGLLSLKYSPAQGMTRLIGFGECWEQVRLPELKACSYFVRKDSYGYDGQFYAQIAVDPLLIKPALERALDTPAYRAQRIFLPALSYLVGQGKPAWILNLYSLWNILFFFLLAQLLWVWLAPRDWFSWAKWLLCLFSMGVLESVRLSLTDLPSAYFILQAIRSRVGGRPLAAGVWFLLAALTRETALLAVPALLGTWRGQDWKREARTSLMVILPAILMVGAWAFYVRERFPINTGSGLILERPFVAMFSALGEAVTKMAEGDGDMRYILRFLCAGGFLIQGIWFFVNVDIKNPLWRLGMVQVFLFPFLGTLVWNGPWAVGRACLTMVLAFNLLLPRGKWGWGLLLLANNTALYAVLRFFGS